MNALISGLHHNLNTLTNILQLVCESLRTSWSLHLISTKAITGFSVKHCVLAETIRSTTSQQDTIFYEVTDLSLVCHNWELAIDFTATASNQLQSVICPQRWVFARQSLNGQ